VSRVHEMVFWSRFGHILQFGVQGSILGMTSQFVARFGGVCGEARRVE
jgi:hypothetical protein